MNVLGAYPGDPGPPGSDMSGIVSGVWDTPVSDAPDALQAGIRVAGLALAVWERMLTPCNSLLFLSQRRLVLWKRALW